MSNNDVRLFDYSGQSVRMVDIDGEPWWVAKDVCDVLGIGNVSQSLSYLDDDEKGIITNDTLGGAQKMSIINEPGLYSLMLRSRKDDAKAFKRWVTHDVLPTIRKTGSYHDKRNKARITRNWFTATLHRHGYEKRHHYIQTTKQMKDAMHIQHKKDDMDMVELSLVTAAEALASARIMQSGAKGYHAVNPLCVDSSLAIEQATFRDSIGA